MSYFFKFTFHNKNYIIFKIQLIGSISFSCIEENGAGNYDLSKFNIDGVWKWVPPGGLVKEWLLHHSYILKNNTSNQDVEKIQNIINNYDKIDSIPYQLIETVINK